MAFVFFYLKEIFFDFKLGIRNVLFIDYRFIYMYNVHL